jgi:hypothetical protein
MNESDKLTRWQKLNMQLSIPAAILLSTMLICTTILLTNRFEMQTVMGVAYVMNRWTGQVEQCLRQSHGYGAESRDYIACYHQD